jgi:D-threo-aldose 1-dehydrogenase
MPPDTPPLPDRPAFHLPELGLGSAPLGNLYRAMSDKMALETVAAALAAGMGLIDTAPHYGQGLAERRVGMALSQTGKRPLISTKVGRVLKPIAPQPAGTERHGFVDGDPYEPAFDYSYDGVMRAFEDSLKRLKLERVDILLGHDLGRVTHGPDYEYHLKAFLNGGYRAMAELRASKNVSAIGLGVNEWAICEQLMQAADPDIFLLAGRYSLLEQGALKSFLPQCARRGIKVLIGGAFNSGILATGTRGPGIAYYNYEPAPPAILERVRRIEAICDAHKVRLAAAALAFPLAHPAVSTVVLGQASPAQVAQTADLHSMSIPDAFWDELRAEALIDAEAPTLKAALKTEVSHHV